MKTRVAFLINSMSGGGAERALSNLLFNSKEYLQGNLTVEVVLLDKDPVAYALPDNVEVTQLDSRHSLRRSIWQVYKAFGSRKPDVVVSSLTRSNLASVIVGRIIGFKTIICEHANTSGHHRANLQGIMAAMLIRVLYRCADRIVCVSNGIRSDLVRNFGVSAARTRVIANPIDVQRIKDLAEPEEPHLHSRPYILGMGRLVSSKNFALLIRAFAKSGFEGDLLILGQGPERESLELLTTELNVAERVRFLGFQSNPFPLIKNASAFVLSSNGEGLPTSIIEAFVLGTPVISTDCKSGPAELLDEAEDGTVLRMRQAKYGILVPPNDVASLAAGISFIADESGFKKLSLASEQGASRYGLHQPVAKYWTEIKSVLS